MCSRVMRCMKKQQTESGMQKQWNLKSAFNGKRNIQIIKEAVILWARSSVAHM